MRNRKFLWGIVAIGCFTGVCACMFVLLLAGGFAFKEMGFWWQEETRTVSIPDPTTPAGTSTPMPAPSPTPIPTKMGISPEILAQMETIQAQVIKLRGLQPEASVERNLLTKATLRERVVDDFFEDYTEQEARDDVRVLVLLGLIEPGFDLYHFYMELLTEQVAGYYDDDSQQMYVVQGEGFQGPERLTYAHEFVHSLQDQSFDFDVGLDFNDEACEEDSERCAAVQALVEGDASLLEEEWLRSFATQKDIEELFRYMNSMDMSTYEAAPSYLQQDFLFPYTYGTIFVRSIHREGGWAAVDDIYAQVPTSTEQILHPERYPHDQPLKFEGVEYLPSLGPGWREIEENTLGEWFTRLTLAEQIEENTAITAAEGWGGDVYSALYNDEKNEGALVLVTLWDTSRDAQEFTKAFKEYAASRFGEVTETAAGWQWDGEEGSVVFEGSRDQTLWIIAPDSDIAASLRLATPFPIQQP